MNICGRKEVSTGMFTRFPSFSTLVTSFGRRKALNFWTIAKEAKALGDLENIKHVLSSLAISLDEAIRGLKPIASPVVLDKRLLSLPDELLAMILEQASQARRIPRCDQIQSLSLVCQRFRHIILNNPRIWSYICSEDEMSYVRACLERSGSAGLSISFTTRSGYSGPLQILAAIAPHSARWKNLEISFTEGLESTQTDAFCRSELLQNLHLPSLRSLCLMVGPKDDESNIYHFHESWDMPSLQQLEINHVPRRFVAPAVTSVRWTARGYNVDNDDSDDSDEPIDEQNVAEIQRLGTFLVAFPALVELDITFIGSGHERYISNDMPSIELPKLNSLRIDIHKSMYARACQFMARTQAPSLRKLEIVLDYGIVGSDEERVLGLLPHDEYPTIEDLTCRIINRKNYREPPVIQLPFEKLQRLRSLTIDAPRLLHFVTGYAPFPALHTLKLNSVSREWVSNLRCLLGKDVFAGLEVLEFGGKASITTLEDIDEELDSSCSF